MRRGEPRRAPSSRASAPAAPSPAAVAAALSAARRAAAVSAGQLRQEYWPAMQVHPNRLRLITSQNRFDVVPGGRRSGKTTDALHRLTLGNWHLGGTHHGALYPPPGLTDPSYVYAAPTHKQAKRVAWTRVLRSLPKWAVRSSSLHDHAIRLVNDASIYVIGMDAPESIEGIAIDGLVLDEYADMKPVAWESSLRPMLSTPGRPPGWAMFIGRPRGRNHFYKLAQRAALEPEDWAVYAWPSWVVMDAKEVQAARRDLDERSFRQEYGGEFLSDVGNVYYQYGDWNLRPLRYDPTRALLFSFDFNVSPGIALVAQDYDLEIDVLFCPRCEAPAPGRSKRPCRLCGLQLPCEVGTAFIDEVWVAENSRTVTVCQELVRRYAQHRGMVVCYGDETGGNRHTSDLRAAGGDWAIIEEVLGQQWPAVSIDLPSVNPAERDRVVATNSRLRTHSGHVRTYIDPQRCPHLCDDLQRTQLAADGSIDKDHDKWLTHCSDAAGYLLWQRAGGGRRGGAELTVESLG